MSLTTYSHGPLKSDQPESIVFMIHGLGANGMDLLSIADYWSEHLPKTLFLSPDAPFPCDMAPTGFQWFSMRDWTNESMLDGLREAAPILNNYISRTLQDYNLPDSKAALMGFSQGTMLSLYAGPRRDSQLAGILGYSGALLGEGELSGPKIQKPPVHLIHGTMDMVVPVDSFYHAQESLTEHGFKVTGGVTHGLSHGIDEQGVEDGLAFLKSVLEP
jgi:phospholipase/carboxylesterase